MEKEEARDTEDVSRASIFVCARKLR